MNVADALSMQIAEVRQVHERIYRLLREKHTALRGRDLQALGRISNEIATAIFELAQVEQARSGDSARICQELGLPADAPLSEILAALDEPDRSRLTGESLGLRSLIGEAHQLAQTNEQLIEFEKEFISGLLQEVLQAASPAADNMAMPRHARFVDLEA